jgi:hypothetical protein
MHNNYLKEKLESGRSQWDSESFRKSRARFTSGPASAEFGAPVAIRSGYKKTGTQL